MRAEAPLCLRGKGKGNDKGKGKKDEIQGSFPFDSLCSLRVRMTA